MNAVSGERGYGGIIYVHVCGVLSIFGPQSVTRLSRADKAYSCILHDHGGMSVPMVSQVLPRWV